MWKTEIFTIFPNFCRRLCGLQGLPESYKTVFTSSSFRYSCSSSVLAIWVAFVCILKDKSIKTDVMSEQSLLS